MKPVCLWNDITSSHVIMWLSYVVVVCRTSILSQQRTLTDQHKLVSMDFVMPISNFTYKQVATNKFDITTIFWYLNSTLICKTYNVWQVLVFSGYMCRPKIRGLFQNYLTYELHIWHKVAPIVSISYVRSWNKLVFNCHF